MCWLQVVIHRWASAITVGTFECYSPNQLKKDVCGVFGTTDGKGQGIFAWHEPAGQSDLARVEHFVSSDGNRYCKHANKMFFKKNYCDMQVKSVAG